MANIVNGTATGSGGLITTGDSSDELQLQTAETTAITINSTQQAIFTAGSASAPAITTTGDTNTGIFFPSADTIAFAEGGAEAARFNSSGNLAFPNGQGIDFSASAGGGASSSILDDYEEGTFTPTIGNGITSPTYTAQVGYYTKIGRFVSFTLRIDLSAGTGAGANLQFTGLPFTSSSASGYFSAAYFGYTTSSLINSTSTNIPTLYISPGTTRLEFYKTDGINFNGTDCNSASSLDVYIVGSYFTA